MNTEKWDILNENGTVTGKTVFRGGNALKKGEYHLVVHILIMSSDGKILIQRRSDKKEPMPGEWAATGGAAKAGESSFSAASRELFEELGIVSDCETLKFLTRIKRRTSFLDIWKIITDIPIRELKLQSSEVAEAKWVSIEDFQKMIENKEYHNYGKDYFSLIFKELRNGKGITV